MDARELRGLLDETVKEPGVIHGIFNWCNQWCERCGQTERCTLYKTSSHLPFDNPEELFETLTVVFETTINMLKEYCEKNAIDFDSLEDSDSEDDYERNTFEIRNDDSVALAKEYGKKVKHWFDCSLKKQDSFSMEVRLQDAMLSDCLEVIEWYQYFFEVKLTRALMSQKDEEEEQLQPYDSLGNAKLLLVSIEQTIGAWGYVYQRFQEDEDEILDILVCLQRLGKRVEEMFPGGWGFMRPGLDFAVLTPGPSPQGEGGSEID